MSPSDPSEKVLKVKCPRCGSASVYSPENSYRPFCSERCKLIDLGQWASGGYAIPTKPTTEAELEALEKAITRNMTSESGDSEGALNDSEGALGDSADDDRQ